MRRTVPFLALISACQASFTSEEGLWRFQDLGLVGEPNEGFGDGQSVLAGTEVCPSATWVDGEVEGWSGDELLAACVAPSLDGGASVTQEGCLLLSEPGEVTWSLDPVACEAPIEPEPDRVVFEVGDPALASAELAQWAEEKAMEGLDLEPPDLLTEALLVPPGEPIRLLEGAEVLLFARLLDGERGQTAAWREEAGEVLVAAESDGVERSREGTLPGGWIALRLEANASADISLRVGEQTWPAGSVLGVAEDELASLDIAAAFVPEEHEASDVRSPWAARAILRDGEGHPVFGAPVTWGVRHGELAVEPGPGENTLLPGPDYAWVTDTCTKPSRMVGERHATLTADYGALSDALDLTWTLTEDMVGEDEGWEPNPHCTGCGCTSRGPQRSGALLLGLAGLLLGWRRHSRSG